jgi:hypothetical protein
MKNHVYSSVAAIAIMFSASAASASGSFAPSTQNILNSGAGVTAHGAGHHVPMPAPMPMHNPMPTPMPMTNPMPRPNPGMGMPRMNGNQNIRINRGFISRTPRFFGGYIAPTYIAPTYIAPTRVISYPRPAGNFIYENGGYGGGYYGQPGYAPAAYAPAPAAYAPQGSYRPDYGPSIRPDAQAYGLDGDGYDPRQGERTEAGTYQGQWTGGYVDPQNRTYRGEWEGAYTGQDGRRYEGTYRGTATGEPVYDRGATSGAPYPAGYNEGGYSQGGYEDRGYTAPRGYEGYERCLRSNGIAGGAIGGVIGAVAGNRIAGRGNRVAGSLIGGGLGALAGVGIEKATKKCKRYLPEQGYYPPVASGYPAQPQPQYYPQQSYPAQPSGYGWQGGYYPQQAAPTTTTVTVVPGNMTTTTTTTEEVVYENVYTSSPRKKVVRRYAPKPKAKCHCN